MTELWDLYTEDREKSGETLVRGQEIPEGRYHLVADAWIVNSKGEYLISQRSASRPTFPLMWESVGGSVLAGEDSLTGAVREVKEEVGLELAPEQGILVFTERRTMVNGMKFHDFKDTYLFRYDGEVSLDEATTDEVCQVRWMTAEQVEELLDTGKMAATLRVSFAAVKKHTEGKGTQ